MAGQVRVANGVPLCVETFGRAADPAILLVMGPWPGGMVASGDGAADAAPRRRMIIVAGALVVDAGARAAYLEGCVEVVAAARRADGCLDFALSADIVDPERVNVFERWSSADALHRFRGSGPDDDRFAALREIRVAEYVVPDGA